MYNFGARYAPYTPNMLWPFNIWNINILAQLMHLREIERYGPSVCTRHGGN